MADTFKFVQGKDYRLAGSGCTAIATSITVKNFVLPDEDETEITMTDFGSVGYGVLDPGTSREEIISFTGVTQNGNNTATLTGVTRGLKFNDDYSADTDLRHPHSGGAKFIISNTPQFYAELSGKDNDEDVTGIWTFSNSNPPRASAAITYGASTEEYFTTKRYVDSVAIAGASDASTTQKGLAEEATQAQVDAGTAADTARLFVNPSTLRAKRYHSFAADAGANDSYAITVNPTISAYTDGDVFVFEAATVNTGAATLNVNAVGAKTIKKYGSVDLATGDIKAGSIVMVVYDADSDTMMLLNSIARPQISQDGSEIYAVASSSGTDAYAATLTPAITAYTDGMLVQVKIDEPNTGAATLNLNSVGAKGLKKKHDQDLDTGDLEDNQIITVVFNSTLDAFQIISQLASENVKYGGNATTRAGDAASGSQTIAHGLGKIPKRVKITAYVGTTGDVSCISQGTYNGTTTASIRMANNAGAFGTTNSANIIDLTLYDGIKLQQATISVDANNITLTWTRTGSTPADTIQILWEAEG